MDWDAYADRYRQVEFKADVPPLLASLLSSRSGNLLDMGCGEGALLDRLRDRFSGSWRLTGFEVSQVRADFARQRGHEVVVAADGEVPLETGAFDVVVSSHVIEHVPDDRAYAGQLARLARPGGHVYVETPLRLAGGWYFRRNPEAGWVLDPTHLREYRSKDEAVGRITSAGLDIVAVQALPITFPLASAEALVRRVVGLRPAAGAPRGLRAKAVPIPRYRELAILARSPESPGAGFGK